MRNISGNEGYESSALLAPVLMASGAFSVFCVLRLRRMKLENEPKSGLTEIDVAESRIGSPVSARKSRTSSGGSSISIGSVSSDSESRSSQASLKIGRENEDLRFQVKNLTSTIRHLESLLLKQANREQSMQEHFQNRMESEFRRYSAREEELIAHYEKKLEMLKNQTFCDAPVTESPKQSLDVVDAKTRAMERKQKEISSDQIALNQALAKLESEAEKLDFEKRRFDEQCTSLSLERAAFNAERNKFLSLVSRQRRRNPRRVEPTVTQSDNIMQALELFTFGASLFL